MTIGSLLDDLGSIHFGSTLGSDESILLLVCPGLFGKGGTLEVCGLGVGGGDEVLILIQ